MRFTQCVSPCFPTSFNDFAQTPVRLQVISFKISRIFFSCAYGTVVMALAGQIKQNVQSDAPKIRTCESVWLTQCLFLMLFCIIFIRVPSKTQWFYTLRCSKYPRFSSLAPAALAELTTNKYVRDAPKSTRLWAVACNAKFFACFLHLLFSRFR